MTITEMVIPTSDDYGQALVALGLNAESLACIDVGGNEPAIVLDRLVEHYSYYQQYIALQESIAQQQRNAHQAQTALRDFPRDTEAQTALSNAQSQIVSLTSQAQTLKTALVNTLLEDLADQSAVPIVIHAEGQIGQLPPAYRLAVDTDDEATKLAWALKKQAVADEQGGSVNSEASYILNTANGQIAVQHALGRVNSYGAQNQIAIDAWMAER